MDVFDGADTRAPLIGRYCGQQRNVVLYSTEHHLLVTFTTLKRTADSQNRGFLAKYEFSESFVKLGTFLPSLPPSIQNKRGANEKCGQGLSYNFLEEEEEDWERSRQKV